MTFADDWTLNNFPAFSFISSHDHFSVILTFRSYIQGMFNEMHKLLSMASVVTQRLTKRSSKYPTCQKVSQCHIIISSSPQARFLQSGPQNASGSPSQTGESLEKIITLLVMCQKSVPVSVSPSAPLLTKPQTNTCHCPHPHSPKILITFIADSKPLLLSR